MKVIDNSQQKFSFLNHSLKHHSFKTLLSLSHLQTGEDIPSMTFLWPFCLCKHTWRKLIQFSSLSSPHSLPCPDTLHNVLFYHHEVCILQCNLETWIQWNTMPKSLKVSIKKKNPKTFKKPKHCSTQLNLVPQISLVYLWCLHLFICWLFPLFNLLVSPVAAILNFHDTYLKKGKSLCYL